MVTCVLKNGEVKNAGYRRTPDSRCQRCGRSYKSSLQFNIKLSRYIASHAMGTIHEREKHTGWIIPFRYIFVCSLSKQFSLKVSRFGCSNLISELSSISTSFHESGLCTRKLKDISAELRSRLLIFQNISKLVARIHQKSLQRCSVKLVGSSCVPVYLQKKYK